MVDSGCHYTEEEYGFFERPENLVNICGKPNWMSIYGDIQQGLPNYHTISISHAFCCAFGMTPEQFMIWCVKYGGLPIK
jgi:hypothetical protein